MIMEQEVVEQVLTRSGLALSQTWVFAEQFPEMIYADINKRWRGELPLTYFFGRDSEPVRHMGDERTAKLIDKIRNCRTDRQFLKLYPFHPIIPAPIPPAIPYHPAPPGLRSS